MTIRGIWNLVRFHWMVLILATCLGAALGAGLANLSQTQYSTKAEVFVGVNNGQSASDIAQGASYSEQQAKNFAAVATRQLVLQSVVDDLGLNMSVAQLRTEVKTNVPFNTSIITVSVTDSNAERAAQIANGVASSLANSVDRLAPSMNNGATPVRLQSVEKATIPQIPSAPRVKLLIVLWAVLGLCLAFAAVAMNDFFRAKVRSPDQAASLTGAPVLGTITKNRDVQRHPIVLPSAPNTLRAEQYREIRTNLRFLQMDQGHKVFVITSAVSGEAKSTTAANLAATFAATGTTVCLVEADLRRPSLAALLDLEGGVGFTSVMAGEAELADVLQDWGDDGLQVLLAGDPAPNPSELLGSRRAEAILTSIRDHFEVTIIDCPPLMAVTDATILSRVFGGAILVVSEQQVEVRELRRAVERMAVVDAPILGTIVTKSRETSTARKYYRPPAAKTSKRSARAKVPVSTDSQRF